MSLLILALGTLCAPLAALGIVLSFVFSSKRGRLTGLALELPERLGCVPSAVLARLSGREIWWLHAASAGEVGGLAPLIEALSRRPDAPAVVLTTTTRSGRDAARALPSVAWAQLAPLDAWPCVGRFISRLAPARLIVAETELWPGTLILAARAGLSPALVNARLTDRSLARYAFIAPLLLPALRGLALVAAQTPEDAERFRSLGIPAERVRVTGNAKYDRTLAPAANDAARARVAAMGWQGAPLFVAGSTHPGEEEIVLAAYMSARLHIPQLRLILAPRHLERAVDAAGLLKHAGLKLSYWSSPVSAGTDALILDAMGVLPSFYALARAAFVGGTLVPVGGHNLLEPALAGVPVLFGRHTGHIERPAKILEDEGGGRRVGGAEDLAGHLAEFGRDEFLSRVIGAQARATAVRLQGATSRILAALETLPRLK